MLLPAALAALLTGCASGGSAPTATKTATATATVAITPTATVPTGYTVYRDPAGYYRLDIPTGWTSSALAGSDGRVFMAPGNLANFIIAYVPNTTVTSSDIPAVTQQYFQSISKDAGGNGTYAHIQGPSQVILGGASWTKEEADVNIGQGNSPLHSVVMITDQNDTAFIVAYAATDFPAAQSKYYPTMLGSLVLLK